MFAPLLIILATTAHAADWRGHIALETRLFLSDPLDPRQEHNTVSLVAQPEFHHSWAEDSQRFVFTPFLRLNQHDDERTHFDVRELYWEKVAPNWDFRIGFRKVFWGVTESQHLVDIVNQTDLVENIDTEEKLGQPMLNFALIRDWGTLEIFLMPYFRERTFPGIEGRFRPQIPIDTGDALYESGAEEWHLDAALRWSHYFGGWDVGLSHFAGTSRDPRFVLDDSRPLRPRLVPYYDQIHQTGLDVQFTRGSWLWKLESIVRSGQEETYTAATAGFEYTFFDVNGSGLDWGLLAEFLWDSRGSHAPTAFENDIFLGTRFTFNDVQSTNILAGLIVDPDTGATLWNLEATRRLGEAWRLSLETRLFTGVPPEDPGYALRKDDYIQLELAWFF
jgi:hypothetical protein